MRQRLQPITKAIRLMMIPLLGLCLLACEDDADIQTYTAPKDQKFEIDRQIAIEHFTSQAGMDQEAERNRIEAEHWRLHMTWTAPENWVEDTTPARMRVTTFLVNDLQIRVSAFPSDVGGLLLNINRWLGQMQMPETTEADMGKYIEPISQDQISGYWINLVQAEVENPQRFLIAYLRPSTEDVTWFVTVQGPVDLVNAMEAELRAFILTFKPLIHPHNNGSGN